MTSLRVAMVPGQPKIFISEVIIAIRNIFKVLILAYVLF